jgi:hypothetical protein
MKKGFSILLLAGIMLYMGGYHLVFSIYQAGIKKEVKTYLKQHHDPSLGTTLNFAMTGNTISDKNFNWEEINEEFIFKGEYYDVAAISRDADSIRIIAIKDGEENSLLEKWQSLQLRNNSQSTASNHAVIKFFPAFCYVATTYDFSISPLQKNHSITGKIFLPLTAEELIGPPPRG